VLTSARIHHGHVVASLGHDAEIVGDDDGGAGLGAQLARRSRI
jgi:hypothetical protein